MRPLDAFGPKSWARPEATGFNRLPMSTLLDGRGDVLPLDGPWSFLLRDRPENVTDDDISGPVDGWRSIEVPGCWTMQGTGDVPRYTNIQMPFDGPPPRVPEQNPTGVYRRTVSVPESWAGRRVVLHVGAAESVLYVHVNGRPVAMGKDSRLPHEVDLTELVEPGRAFDLALTVVRWSDATYLEDQDHWHHAGLHRSVVMYSTSPVHIADVHVTADYDVLTGEGRLRTVVWIGARDTVPAGWTVPGRRRWPGGERAGPVRERDRSDRQLVAVHRTPRRHDPRRRRGCALDRGDSEPVAGRRRAARRSRGDARPSPRPRRVRRVEVVGHELRVNGRPVLIKGVNRHDHDPHRGKAVPRAEIERELLLMKRHGINAIRTSHYPNDPALYELCDRLGLYVVGEANLESHAYLRSLTKDPRWGPAILERITRVALRDKNHPSIIVWSLGNESGSAPILAAAAAWLRRWDPSRPVQYEGGDR